MKDGDKLVQTYTIQKDYKIYHKDQYWWRGFLMTDRIIDFKILLAMKCVIAESRN